MIAAAAPWIQVGFPGVDRMVRIGLREIVMDVPPQEVITRDNALVQVDGVVFFQVLDGFVFPG